MPLSKEVPYRCEEVGGQFGLGKPSYSWDMTSGEEDHPTHCLSVFPALKYLVHDSLVYFCRDFLQGLFEEGQDGTCITWKRSQLILMCLCIGW